MNGLIDGITAMVTKLFTLVVIVLVGVALFKWAQAHPAQLNHLVNSVIGAVVGGLTWIADEVSTVFA